MGEPQQGATRRDWTQEALIEAIDAAYEAGWEARHEGGSTWGANAEFDKRRIRILATRRAREWAGVGGRVAR